VALDGPADDLPIDPQPPGRTRCGPIPSRHAHCAVAQTSASRQRRDERRVDPVRSSGGVQEPCDMTAGERAAPVAESTMFTNRPPPGRATRNHSVPKR